MGGRDTTSIDGERVVDLTEITEPDGQARDRVRADGGETNREGPSSGGGVLGLDVMGSLGSLKSPGGSSLGEDEIGMDLTYLCF